MGRLDSCDVFSPSAILNIAIQSVILAFHITAGKDLEKILSDFYMKNVYNLRYFLFHLNLTLIWFMLFLKVIIVAL